jgi:hypothetical protein
LTDEDRTRLRDDFEVGGEHSVAEGVSTALVGMLLDPRFLYFVETDGEEIEPGIVALTDHELAARLARVLWDSIPDDELIAAASEGLDDDALVAQVERMLADDRARPAISRFTSDWLTLDVLPQPPATLFADAATREAVRVAMKDELARFVERVAPRAAVGGTIDNAMAVPGAVLTWVTGQRGRSVRIEREIVVGEPLPSEVELTVVPDNRDYAYAVVNERRVIVEPKSHPITRPPDQVHAPTSWFQSLGANAHRAKGESTHRAMSTVSRRETP